MAEQSPDYKQLYLELRAKNEEEQRRHEEKQRRHEEEQRRHEAALDRAEQRTRKTTIPEFLDACHIHQHFGATIQMNATLSTLGDPGNELRPEKIVLWEDFPAQQAAIWDALMGSEFAFERHLTSLHALEEIGENILSRTIRSEIDLHIFQRYTVDDHVMSVIHQLNHHRTLRRTFGLQGLVEFNTNHTETLNPEWQLEEGIGSMTVSGTQRSSRPRADQFCFYNMSTLNTETRVAAYITQFKPLHKLPLGCIYEGLEEDIRLDDVVQHRETDTPRDHFRRLIAAVITQAFSYMVKVGVAYGCVWTGEAFVFLRVPDDPRTVHYFLSVPKGDVGEATGWAPNSDRANRLHLTAVGQMLAFTLQAFKTPPRSQQWRVEAVSQLNSWEFVYEDLLDAIPVEDLPSSEYRPPQHDEFLRMSPVQLRRRHTPISSLSCGQPQDQNATSDEESDCNTLSQQQPSGQYCTQNCLLGLVKGGQLDMSCPNVQDHGRSHHQIDRLAFLTRIRQQLSDDLDTDCKPASRPSACGVLFQVRLKSHGYIVAAKCTPIDFVYRLQHEAAMYDLLRAIQGIHVQVHLGNIDLATPYYYDGICELVHVMFLSFGGKQVYQHLTTDNIPLIVEQLNYSAQSIHNLGVMHNALEPSNMLWNEETGRVMVVNFEWARVVQPRTVISPNQKKKKVSAASMAQQEEDDVFVQERQTATDLLRWSGGVRYK